MLRLILIILLIFIFAIPLGLLAMLVAAALGLFSPHAREVFAQFYLRVLMGGVILLSGSKVAVYGRENIPAKGGCLFIGNHRSFFDIFLQYQYILRPCGTIAKIEWKKVPILRVWMKFIRCPFLDRSSLRSGVEVTKQAEQALREGRAVMIYPEGTRGHKDGILPFHDGSFKSAFVTASPVVPVTYVHTDDIFENHIPFIRPANVTVVFGKPVPTEGLDRAAQKVLAARVHEQIEETYRRFA